MKEIKPKKIIYENQEDVHNKISNFLQSMFKGIDCKAYLVGSSTTQKFGKYDESNNEENGSDIDIVVFTKKVPSNWKKLQEEKDWWNMYRAGELEINKTIHFANAMVVKKGKEDTAKKKFKELKWVVEKIK